MKKLFFYILLLPFIFSCKKDEITDEMRPDAKLNAALSKYNDLLSSSAEGWKGHLYPATGGGFGFLFNFDGKNRVEMLSDIDDHSSVTFFKSSYRIKATTLPSLYFDTYSYLHLLADPDPQVNGGTPGWGLYSDFEFSIFETSADTVKLKGNLNGSILVLVKATPAEAEAYKKGNLKVLRNNLADYLSINPFNYLQTNQNKSIAFNINTGSKQLILSYDSAGVFKKKSVGFAFSGINDLVLRDRISIENIAFNKIQLTADKSSLMVINGDKKTEVQVSADPLFSFDQMLGVQFSNVVLPFEEDVAGSGTEYNSVRNTVLTNSRTALAAGSTFPELRMSFNKTQKTMLIDLTILQGGQTFSAIYAFYYTEKNESYTFEYGGGLNGNATYLEQAFQPFITAITTGSFKFDYVLGRPELMGSGLSAAKPNFKFIGYLR